MRTIVFLYSNKQQMVFTAEGSTELDTAIGIARENMPQGANSFCIVCGKGIRSHWMR